MHVSLYERRDCGREGIYTALVRRASAFILQLQKHIQHATPFPAVYMQFLVKTIKTATFHRRIQHPFQLASYKGIQHIRGDRTGDYPPAFGKRPYTNQHTHPSPTAVL